MNIPHDKFCVLPWVSLEASPIGTVRPCCLALDEITDNNGNKYRLKDTPLSEIQNSQYMTKLRQEFLDGQKPQTCRRCWQEERTGRTSKRMHTLDRLKHMGIEPTWTADAKPLMFLDLKLGNICNLKCRICGSWSSSKWAAEELDYMPSGANKKEHIAYKWLKDGAWPRKSEVFWDNLKRLLPNIKYFEFTGGEPWLIKEHWDLFTTYQFNYSLLREITADNWLGIGGGVKEKFNWGKASLSYAMLYQNTNYFYLDPKETLGEELYQKYLKYDKLLFEGLDGNRLLK